MSTSKSPSSPPPIVKALTAAMNSGPAKKQEDAFYKHREQDYFTFVNGQWTSSSSATGPAASRPEATMNTKSIRVISWNIDVLVPFWEERMRSALNYLQNLVSSTAPETPVILFLQEMGQSDLEQIRDSVWIQERFKVTDVYHNKWLNPLYGTTTLIDRRLHIRDVFRVPWISKFDRDGLFVDIALSNSDTSAIWRLCNTHLESLVAEVPVRPLQLAAAAPYLHDSGVAAALLAGDLNAIEPFDRELRIENKLRDTYLELGGQEDSHDGYTWGYQVPQYLKGRFGCSRMDKILITGDVQPLSFQRIGMGVKVADDVLEEVSKQVEGGWVTDHYGVMGDFELTGGWAFAEGEHRGEVKSRLA